jgi:hypothetical protein
MKNVFVIYVKFLISLQKRTKQGTREREARLRRQIGPLAITESGTRGAKKIGWRQRHKTELKLDCIEIERNKALVSAKSSEMIGPTKSGTNEREEYLDWRRQRNRTESETRERES